MCALKHDLLRKYREYIYREKVQFSDEQVFHKHFSLKILYTQVLTKNQFCEKIKIFHLLHDNAGC